MEWNKPLTTVTDLEEDGRYNTYTYSVKVKFEWHGVELSIDDMPWFLRQNRYRINRACTGPWYYVNFEYFFKNYADKKLFEEIAIYGEFIEC